MEDIVLPRTSLCAIVRDEMINPSGGISRFIKSVMPHVEKGVIVDTGSVDGTRAALNDSCKEFPNLTVYETKFEGYAEARNFSLSKVKTDRALILDADEIIIQEDYKKIKEILDGTGIERALKLGFTDVYFDGEAMGYGHGERIIPKIARFYNEGTGSWHREFVEGGVEYFSKDSFIDILHFRTTISAKELKYAKWYVLRNLPQLSPSQVPEYMQWKTFNPLRNNYKGSNLDIFQLPSTELAKST